MYTPAKKPVQLVKNFFDVPVKKRLYPLAASLKFDGQLCFLRAGVGYSRTGKEYTSLLPLARRACDILPDHVVIGEFMTYCSRGHAEPVNVISGNFRRDDIYPSAVCVIHDIIPIEDFDRGECDTPYIFRMEEAEPLFQHPSFMENPLALIKDEDEAVAYAQKLIEAGEEGAVFKNFDGVWRAGKRTPDQMKIKGEVSYDLEVVGIETGKGKYADTLGTLLCRWSDNRVVRISGMSDAQRDEWYNFPDGIIGQIVQVDGMCLTPDGMIREPRFKGVRFDKYEADV